MVSAWITDLKCVKNGNILYAEKLFQLYKVVSAFNEPFKVDFWH